VELPRDELHGVGVDVDAIVWQVAHYLRRGAGDANGSGHPIRSAAWC
jgi:hypothetical protein